MKSSIFRTPFIHTSSFILFWYDLASMEICSSLSLTGKRWILDSSNSSNLVDRLLHERSLDVSSSGSIINPNVLPDMRKSVKRIEAALKTKEKVAIFGDYDCDGITASAQLVRFFKRKGINPIIRLPHRVNDGYGLSNKIVDEFIEQKITLLITVDTGISSVKEISKAQEAGVDVIVSDHHSLQEELPPALALLHPALAPAYPHPHPAGAGVAHQLLRALEGGTWSDSNTDVILAMIGTIADLVELKGDNRIVVQRGLAALSRTTDKTILKLIEISGLKHQMIKSMDIAFRIAPRINASGRMAHPQLALDALLGDFKAMHKIDELNKTRQKDTEKLYSDALKNLDTEMPLLTVAGANYPHGIIGLIAGRLTEQFGRPSAAAVIDGDECTASLRSPPCYNISDGLTRCQDLIERFGGHAQAAGCTVLKKNWKKFCKALSDDIIKNTKSDDLLPTLKIDAVLEPSEVTFKLIKNLSRLEPYGQGNREPLFMIKNVVLDEMRCVGSDETHLQCRIEGIKCVGFGLGKLIPEITGAVDIVCRLGMDVWHGYKQPQMMIVDIRSE